jgi:hypothetical protein
MGELTPKQKAFADNYIANGGNASEAARKAGYSERNAGTNAGKLLKNSKIASYIAEKQAEVDKLNGTDTMSLADIQKRRAMIATGEVRILWLRSGFFRTAKGHVRFGESYSRKRGKRSTAEGRRGSQNGKRIPY